MVEDADACATAYKSSLDDLNCNSKLHINVLTLLAEESAIYASVIAETIINHIKEAETELKLPVLYLIDSIIKNVGQEYLTIFSQHIVSIFTSVFQKVDERTRSHMYKLRVTWNTVFPNKILYDLDVKTKELDPAWPINAQSPSGSIHINPKFLANSAQVLSPNVSDGEVVKAQQQEILKQLLDKQNQLKVLQDRKNVSITKQPQNLGNKIPMQASVQPIINQIIAQKMSQDVNTNSQAQTQILHAVKPSLKFQNVNTTMPNAESKTSEIISHVLNTTHPTKSDSRSIKSEDISVQSSRTSTTSDPRLKKVDPKRSETDSNLKKHDSQASKVDAGFTKDPRLLKRAIAKKLETSESSSDTFASHIGSASCSSVDSGISLSSVVTTVSSVVNVVKNKGLSQEIKSTENIKHKDIKTSETKDNNGTFTNKKFSKLKNEMQITPSSKAESSSYNKSKSDKSTAHKKKKSDSSASDGDKRPVIVYCAKSENTTKASVEKTSEKRKTSQKGDKTSHFSKNQSESKKHVRQRSISPSLSENRKHVRQRSSSPKQSENKKHMHQRSISPNLTESRKHIRQRSVSPNQSESRKYNRQQSRSSTSPEDKKYSRRHSQSPTPSEDRKRARHHSRSPVPLEEKRHIRQRSPSQEGEKKHTHQHSRSPSRKSEKKSPKSQNSHDSLTRSKSTDKVKRKLLIVKNESEEADTDLRCFPPSDEDHRIKESKNTDSDTENEPPEKKVKEDKEPIKLEDE